MDLREYIVNYMSNLEEGYAAVEEDVLDAIDDYEDLTDEYVSQSIEDDLIVEFRNGTLS